MHYSGFVNIVGKPNVGKSTLMNTLVGEKMSIITPKAQTTRHRIIGIWNDEEHQVVFSDTPGFIEKPAYKMHHRMNNFVSDSFDDADLVLFMTEPAENYEETDPLFEKLNQAKCPVYLVLNKIDSISLEKQVEWIEKWKKFSFYTEIFPISALNKKNTKELFKNILKQLPEGPAWYDKEQLTDRSERFFASEIIREKILLLYQQEIPYSVEIAVHTYKEDPERPLIRISAYIFVERESQKMIIIGKGGTAIKKLGIAARKDIEAFTDKQVHLELQVKIKDNWRDDERSLEKFGY